MTVKKMLIVLAALMICCTCAAWAEDKTGRVMSPDMLQQRLDQNPYLNLFDVRSQTEYDEAHIPFAASTPLFSLREMMQEVLSSGFSYMNTEIIVYGETEEQGKEAAEILKGLGFTNVWRLASLSAWTGRQVSAEEEMRILGNLDTVDIYGNAVNSALLSGCKLTMVNVWATYCTPCISEMSDLGRLADDVKDMGVQIIGLLSDTTDAAMSPVEEKVNLARQIVKETQANYPHLLPSSELYWKIIGQISAVPTTFFVDETGMLIGSAYVGARSYDAWYSIIKDMLNQM